MLHQHEYRWRRRTLAESLPEPAEPNYFKATAVESGQSYVFVAGGMYNMLF